MVSLIKHDLEFILKQIKVAEAHSAGGDLASLVGNPLVPYGLRTVSGVYNNLVPGSEYLGSSDQIMPRLLDPDFNAAEQGTSYEQSSGSVYDSQPRTISNLISDQTIGNPAVIIAALTATGHADPYATLLANQATYDVAVDAYKASVAAEKTLAVAQASKAALFYGPPPSPAAIAAADAAIAAAQGSLDQANALKAQAYEDVTDDFGLTIEGDTVVIPNVSADLGDTAPFNGFFTLFGQFFDHGLDLVSKGGSGAVYIPLQPDDPLYVPGSPTNFMVLTRAQNQPGADGVLGTADDVHEHTNETTPFIDLNQVYTSNPSHQVFLREYAMVDGKPVATGRMLEGAMGGPATWADVKAQARDMLGIELTDADVLRVPAVLTDLYGEFVRGANGFPQLVTANGPVEGAPDALASAASALSAGRAFLNDIAHTAVPSGPVDHDRNPATAPVAVLADADTIAGNPIAPNMFGISTTYDNELLDRHFIVGDGRGNENIGLTSVHHVFHHEHNRQIDEIKKTVLESGDLAFINQWLAVDLTSAPTAAQQADPAFTNALGWDGERLFQAARFSTEMVYQHLVFEEFARAVSPNVDAFLFSNTVDIDPSIMAEFAHVVYRFGHSMLVENVDRLNLLLGETGEVTGVAPDHIGLIDAFLDPLDFEASGADAEAAAGAILRGMSRQVGNEIDEHVTDALRNNLVGLPLDLGALNMARARETGVPSLNEARTQFYEQTHDSMLKPYDSWFDFALSLKTPASIINFIAAYGTHPSIVSAVTMEDKRDAALALVMGGDGAPADRGDFLNATGAYAGGSLGGLNNVDFWIGGLAEKKMPFGGMLGSTFNFVFEVQMEKLQDGDRLYYLSRTQGLNLLNELEADSFAQLLERNTDIGESGVHINGAAFQSAAYILEMDQARQHTGLGADGKADPLGSNPVLAAINPLVIRQDLDNDGDMDVLRYTGGDHVVLGGTHENDIIVGGEGDDTLWGDGGNDRLEGGFGVDHLHGGAGDDIITDSGTDVGAADVIHGDDGNDVINGGNGLDLIFGGDGKDFIYGGSEDKTISGGRGDDFIMGPSGLSFLAGNEGDDWIEGGDSFDTLAGENSELFFNSTIIGHDVLDGRGNDNDYDAESGDDIMVQGSGIQRNNGMAGFDWAIHKGNEQAADSDMNVSIFTNQQNNILRDRFDLVEGLSGWDKDDRLVGREVVVGGYDANGNATQVDPDAPLESYSNALLEKNISLISGLDQLTDHLARTQVTVAGKTETIVMDTSDASDIILGGGGSDTIEGMAGNDILDGDRWLNVRISVRTPEGAEIGSADGMSRAIHDANGDVLFSGRTVAELMFDGTFNPSQLHIVREILDGGKDGDVDTAVFWDVKENYEFTANEDGSVTVEHATVTAGVIDQVSGRARESDGVDRLFNIEKLQFANGALDVAQLFNAAPVGLPIISDMTPTEGLTLTVDTSGVSDANGLGTFSYQWQVSEDGGTTWTNLLVNANGPSFTPNDGLLGVGSQVGDVLRVRVTYVDGAGNAETLFSTPTGVVGDNWDAIPFVANTFNGTAGDDIADGTSGLFGLGASDTLNGNAGNDILNGFGGADTLTGGAGDDRLDGGAGTDTAVFAGNVRNFAFGSAGAQLVVTDTTGAEGVDTLSTVETLRFNGQNYAVTTGSTFANTLTGAAGSQIIFGLEGADAINGGAGSDVIVAGDGDDTVTQIGSAGGVDIVDGGAGADTYQLNGSTGAESFTIYSRAAALDAFAGLALAANTEIVVARNNAVIAELDNIEEIRVNTLQVTSPGGAGGGADGGDTITVVGDFTGTSLSFSTITIDGAATDDTVDISSLSSAHRIVFRSNGGNDTIVGTLRPQDVIELPAGTSLAAVETVDNGDGTKTVRTGLYSVTFAAAVMPALAVAGTNDDETENEEDADDDHPDGVDEPSGSSNDDETEDDEDEDEEAEQDDDASAPAPVPASASPIVGTAQADVLGGGGAGEDIIAFAGDDVITAGGGADTVLAGDGADFIRGGDGRDMIFGGAGDDHIFGEAGSDMIYGEAGADRIFAGDGDDLIDAGAGNDVVAGDAGHDVFVAAAGDGDDSYDGGDGVDTLDMSALTAGVQVDLGSGLRGSASSAQSGVDNLRSIEHVITGSGADVITASLAANILDGGDGADTFRFESFAAADGDRILGFEPGDKIDLSGIDANLGVAGDQAFALGASLSSAGQLTITYETTPSGQMTVIQGNVDANPDADFRLELEGHHTLTDANFVR